MKLSVLELQGVAKYEVNNIIYTYYLSYTLFSN
jgi:hypothetical protein